MCDCCNGGDMKGIMGETERHRLQSSIAPGSVIVADTGNSPFEQILLDGRHVLRADEPVAVGGKDSGPGPYELLLMALGACTSMTLRMYATRSQWPLENVVVRLSHAKVHAADCQDCESERALLDRIDRSIELIGPLDATQRARLLQIADMCPVHRTLTSKIDVRTELVAT
jgi:putative redox protein